MQVAASHFLFPSVVFEHIFDRLLRHVILLSLRLLIVYEFLGNSFAYFSELLFKAAHPRLPGLLSNQVNLGLIRYAEFICTVIQPAFLKCRDQHMFFQNL